ncbi:MAG: hypothetical protein P1U42_06205 [Phycisphaerales bacterium]|nr:hypothetical protein [Phycisphaerales bacterium]
MNRNVFAIAVVSAFGTSVFADTPTLGGPMSHLLITLFQNQIFVTYESPSMSTVEMQDNDGSFVGNTDVLNDMGYNAQFGWLANGFISLPPSSGIFVRTISSSPHLSVYEEGSFSEILGTGLSDEIWQWDGTMTHNWYATDVHGPHSARYEVFVGDLAGNPLLGFESGFIDFNFVYGPDLSGRIGNFGHSVSVVPSSNTLSAFAIFLIPSFKRRRRAN